MRILLIGFLILPISCVGSERISSERSAIELPRYGAPIRVVDGNGKSLMPKASGETAGYPIVRLLVSDDFVPKDERSAACEMTKMLPADFLSSLIERREEFRSLGYVAADTTLSSRFFDLSTYLKSTWGSAWSKEPDSVARLVNLLFVDSPCAAK